MRHEGRAGRRGRQAAIAVGAVLLMMVWQTGQPAGPRDDHSLLAQAGSNEDVELVYLDPDRTIRVFDPAPAFEGVDLEWASPEGGWDSFALGDVTGDSDVEIIAIRGEADLGRLTIYDPVAVGSPDDAVQDVNGVPWATLYTQVLPGPPLLVGTGEFDAARDGNELVYVYTLPPDQRTDDSQFRLAIARAATQSADGRAWEELAAWDTGIRWTWLATGDLDGIAPEEIALVSSEAGNLSIYRVANGGMVQIYQNADPEIEWRAAEFGQYTSGGAEELAAIRDINFPLATAWVFGWADGGLRDVYSGLFLPSPREVFLADISGNGDVEVVMLRSVRQELGLRPRLIVRDNDNDTISMREAILDADNGYSAGAGGDFDGDGRDEIAVMRSNRLRIFTEPETSASEEDHDLSSVPEILRAGDLDGEGLARSPRLAASVTELSFTTRAGTASDPQTVRITDSATGSAIPVEGALESGSSWASWSMSGTSTPLNLSVFANSAGLQTGTYAERLVIGALTADVTNDPLRINLSLTVESGISPDPEALSFIYYPCQDATVRTAQVQLAGEEGKLYSTSVAGQPQWVQVSPATGELPEAVTVSVDPSLRPGDFVEAVLVISVDWPGAPDTQERIPVRLLCAGGRALLPSVYVSP